MRLSRSPIRISRMTSCRAKDVEALALGAQRRRETIGGVARLAGEL